MSTSPTENDIYIPNGITDTSDATALDVLPQREAQRESSDDREQETKIKTGTGQGDEATDLGSQERDEAQLVDAGERFEEEKDECENGMDGMDAEGGARAENTVSLHDEQTFEAAPQADTSEHASSSLIANEPAADEEALAPREAADGAPEAESGADVTDTQSPAPRNANIRPPTPSSRTSTPPLTAPSRKFSSINVNKKFLTKTASPAAGASATVTKLGSLSGECIIMQLNVFDGPQCRPAASPVSISSAPSRLLSTKLTTIPSSKSNISPHPPSSAGTAGSPSNSPWAKPAASLGGESPQDSRPLHQPAPRQSRSLTTTIPVVMGSGQGISVSAPKPAWRQVPVEGRRAALGVSRDFPTTNEIAEGKLGLLAVCLVSSSCFQARRPQ